MAMLWYPGAIRHESPWQNDGPANGRQWPQNVTIAVQHHTDGGEASVVNTFTSPQSGRHVSAHFMVTRTGKVHQFVQLDNIAWHAGDWDANVHSVGIEHEQSEADTASGWQDWPQVQLQASARVQVWLAAQMPGYDMRPHSAFTSTGCPGNLPIDQIKRLMGAATMADTTATQWTDEATGFVLRDGMYARWQQLYALLGNELYLIVGHPTSDEFVDTDGVTRQKFEHETWEWRKGQSPERFDILATIINPPAKAP